MTPTDEIPEIHVEWMEIITVGAAITPDESAAQVVAGSTGTTLQIWRPEEREPFHLGPDAILDTPEGTIHICDRRGSTEILSEPHGDDLGATIGRLAAVTNAVAQNAGHPPVESLSITVAM